MGEWVDSFPFGGSIDIFFSIILFTEMNKTHIHICSMTGTSLFFYKGARQNLTAI